jgi:hypothetical protein
MRTSGIGQRGLGMRDMVQHLTGGRPFIFIIMAYDDRWELFKQVRQTVAKHFDLACIRADHVKSGGYDLLAKIHFLIDKSELVMADISKPSPNVYYEIGYAVGVQKQPLLLVQKGTEIPTDLKGLEVVEYRYDRDGKKDFERDVVDHLRLRMSSELPLLRDMLEAPVSQPAYIISSPKYPGRNSRILGQVYDQRTYGDHLGILGLISAFGSMWGEAKGIDLISGQHSPPDLLTFPASLYLIGSGKVNKPSVEVLKMLQKDHKEPNWQFGPAPGYSFEHEDWPVVLYRTKDRKKLAVKGKIEKIGPDKADVWTQDYGIIVRGPHPQHPDRLVLIIAGAHSLGTGAACLAATRSALIKQIKEKLPEGALEDKTRTFWVLVKGRASGRDHLLDEDGVSIEEAGVYGKRKEVL